MKHSLAQQQILHESVDVDDIRLNIRQDRDYSPQERQPASEIKERQEADYVEAIRLIRSWFGIREILGYSNSLPGGRNHIYIVPASSLLPRQIVFLIFRRKRKTFNQMDYPQPHSPQYACKYGGQLQKQTVTLYLELVRD